jgi:hypothetical protein
MSPEIFSELLFRLSAEREARLEALWRMTPNERIASMRRGDLSMEQCCAWAARYPQQVPLINGEFAFIAAYMPEVCLSANDRARRYLRFEGLADEHRVRSLAHVWCPGCTDLRGARSCSQCAGPPSHPWAR